MNEYFLSYDADESISAVIWNLDAEIWDVSNIEWTDWDSDNLADYKTSLTGTGQRYIGSFDTNITAPDWYFVQFYDDTLGEVVRDGWIYWTGQSELFIPPWVNVMRWMDLEVQRGED